MFLMNLYVSISVFVFLHAWMHISKHMYKVCVEVCPFIMCIYVGRYLHHFEDDIIIGHCALHWTIHLFIHSVSQYFFSL